jgi:hypothetical protein
MRLVDWAPGHRSTRKPTNPWSTRSGSEGPTPFVSEVASFCCSLLALIYVFPSLPFFFSVSLKAIQFILSKRQDKLTAFMKLGKWNIFRTHLIPILVFFRDEAPIVKLVCMSFFLLVT